MQFMKFKSEYGIHMATNCPVELDILEVTNLIEATGKTWKSYLVSTAKTHDVFKTWDDAVRFAEHKFGIIMEFA